MSSPTLGFSPLLGLVKTAEIMLFEAGISPITTTWSDSISYREMISYVPIPLHEPVLVCRPLVSVLPVQKWMKLAASLSLLVLYIQL